MNLLIPVTKFYWCPCTGFVRTSFAHRSQIHFGDGDTTFFSALTYSEPQGHKKPPANDDKLDPLPLTSLTFPFCQKCCPYLSCLCEDCVYFNP